MVTKVEAARELLKRRKARKSIAAYIGYTNPKFHTSNFSEQLCAALDKFVDDVRDGKRPILVLSAPPQHGKSEVVSRKLPAYLMGRYPEFRIGGASYADSLASAMAQDVRRNLASDEHKRLFPVSTEKRQYAVNRMGEFTTPGGTGSYIGVGVGSGLTGRPLDIAIVDDATKNAEEALSPTVKEGVWNWYQSVLKTRLSENSGVIIMATRWAEDDLSGRVIAQHRGDSRLTVLNFPAINEPDYVGFNPELPRGALVPQLHPIEQLHEFKAELSDYFFSAMYQGSPKNLGGNVFQENGIRYYMPKDLPKKFDKMIMSVDAAFKDTDASDFVVAQVWGKSGAKSYLLDQTRARMSFTKTCIEVQQLKIKWPDIREVLIEDKANGPAIIDALKDTLPGIIPVEPDGSKLARAHAVTAFWEAGNVYLPHPDAATFPVKELISELTMFPAAANDDQVDALTQALRRLYPLHGRIAISNAALARASSGR